jgi:hypothetical protein
MPDASLRADQRDAPWPLRPWLMAALCAVAGVVFQWLLPEAYSARGSATATVGATFVAVAALAFVLTVEQRRWWWALLFALAWGLVIGVIAMTTSSYNRVSSLFEWPFLSGVVAVMIAAPLFQSARDDWQREGGDWRLNPARVHGHAWTDAVIAAAALLFIAVAFALAWLIAGLFNIIGIRLFRSLLLSGWFAWGLAGFAFGAAVGMLRERDALVATMQRLVMIVLAVLAPVLAVALLLFLCSLPFTGLSGLWNGWVSAAALTLAAAAGCYTLLNAAIGPGGEDRQINPILHWSALVLALAVLPLAALAMAALATRVGDYGWTPSRLWGVICAGIALAYGTAGWWAVARRRLAFDGPIRWIETWLALGVCVIALLLALPIVDFGAISARDQVARLRAGALNVERFDWTAMAFDFGPAGRSALIRIRDGDANAEARRRAGLALRATTRYDLDFATRTGRNERPLESRLRVLPAGRPLPADAIDHIRGMPLCAVGTCVVQWIDDGRLAVIGRPDRGGGGTRAEFVRRDNSGEWSYDPNTAPDGIDDSAAARPDLSTARIELREVRRRQMFVDGRPVGGVVE